MNALQTIRLIGRLNPIEVDRIIAATVGKHPSDSHINLNQTQLERMLQEAYSIGFNRDVIKTEYAT